MSAPRCLVLTPYPVRQRRHGGQVRAGSCIDGLRQAGWDVTATGIYSGELFDEKEHDADDITIVGEALGPARRDLLFYDYHVARAAAADPIARQLLAQAIERTRPDVIHLDQPWGWLPLRASLPDGPRPKLVYSSHNVEWRIRRDTPEAGLRRSDLAEHAAATRALEAELLREADLVISISDLEAAELSSLAGKPVLYVPPASTLADRPPPVGTAPPVGTVPPIGTVRAEPSLTTAATDGYVALLGSAYWPNIEGFFQAFPEGLGFLRQRELVWVGGSLGAAIRDDPRYRDYRSLNDSRYRALGYVDEGRKAAFFAASAAVLVPVFTGGGAKLKTADAMASGRPVITSAHALDGYGPVIATGGGTGIHVAAAPEEFRRLIRQALSGELAGCGEELRAALSPKRLGGAVDRAYRALVAR